MAENGGEENEKRWRYTGGVKYLATKWSGGGGGSDWAENFLNLCPVFPVSVVIKILTPHNNEIM